MTSAVLLVLAALATAPELCAGRKGGGVAREALDVSEGYEGAVELGSAEDKKVIASTVTTVSISERKDRAAKREEKGAEKGSETAALGVVSTASSTAAISERAVKDAVSSAEDSTSHRRKTNYRAQKDDNDVSEGYAGAEDLPANDEEFPAIVGQLPQSAEELPGLKDVEMVEEIEEYLLLFGVVVFFVIFGVFPALQHFRADGKGGMDTLMEVAVRFSIVQQALAVLGLTHHLDGMAAMQQQHEQDQVKRRNQPKAASLQPQPTAQKAAASYTSNSQDESYVPSSAHGQSHTFEPELRTEGSNIGSLLELATTDNSAEPAEENNVLDSLGLIDTEEPLL